MYLVGIAGRAYYNKDGQKIIQTHEATRKLLMSDDEIVDRISKRRTCPNPTCREIYNLDFKNPKVEGICDKCGTKLIIREDDNEATIRERLKNYHNLSENLIEFYKNKDILYTVKLNNESNKVSSDVAKEIKEYLRK